MTASLSKPQSGAAFNGAALIHAHPQAELIRQVQRSAYRAYSRTHKLGLTALSWLGGLQLGFCSPLWMNIAAGQRALPRCHPASVGRDARQRR